MKKNPLRIFDFTDYRRFLEEFYRVEKSRDSKFSHRFIHAAIGASSSGWFADLIKGRINLTGTHLLKLVRMLGLNPTEGDYFESMVHYAQASSFEEKNRFLERMMSFKELKTDLLGKDKFEYYSKWYYAGVRELLFILDFRGDFSDLARRLNPPIRPRQARDAIALLERLELIRADETGRYLPHTPVLRKDTAFKSEFLVHFLRAQMQLGMEALDRFEPEERDVSSLTLLLSREDFLRAKEEIRALRKKLLAWSEKPKDRDKVYQCNFQVFPIST